ncbi:MAG: endonuclease/exonuclease/phosphatase family protein [Campylobacterota bacterium]|nr:endonuclease/exonuclease/phosphatase family protein [Campylobacterota bacterium]
MFRLLLILFVPFYLFATQFKVASYNVENLFDAVKNGTEYDEYIPGKHNWSERMADIKLTHISEVICDLDADIVALQEIENEGILMRLQKRLKRVGCDYSYHSIARKKKTTIRVAILSRYPIVNEREIRVNYSSRDRDILEATVKIKGQLLTLFVNHWKAKSRSGYESRRVNYARALAKRIDALPKKREYLIVGDLNSHYDEYRVLSKRLNDTKGKTGINHTLKSIKGDDLVSEHDIQVDNEGRHFNLWLELAPSRRWSHKYYGHRGSIDHILIPQSLVDGKGIDYVNNSYSVFRAPYLFTREGWINGWDYSGSKHKGRGYSDHLPIYATFSMEPYQPEKVKKPVLQKIENLYTTEELSHPVRLENCVVILKRGTNAVIKQSPKGKAIYIYAAAAGLQEGQRYDLTVSEIATYKGMKEIMRIEQVKKLGSVTLKSYYLEEERLDSGDPALQNQVFVDLIGVYRNNHFEIEKRRIPIYFKKKRNRPADGTKLKIFYAHLGYYRKPQLVVYDRKDFKEMEK